MNQEKELIAFIDKKLEGVYLQLGSQKYPYYLFLVKDNKTIIYQDTENGRLWVNYNKIWRFLESDFKLNYSKIQSFICRYVALRYNLRVVTPGHVARFNFFWLHLDTI